jgi:hypothetical protein
MAGGLFGRPFAINLKCILFAVVCIALFLCKPTFQSNWTLYGSLFAVFVVAYVAMAWYDYFFDCRVLPFERGRYSLTGLLKPEAGRDRDRDRDPTRVPAGQLAAVSRTRHHSLVFFAHLLLVAPLLLYIGVYRERVHAAVYPVLVVLAVATALYHGGKLVGKDARAAGDRS